MEKYLCNPIRAALDEQQAIIAEIERRHFVALLIARREVVIESVLAGPQTCPMVAPECNAGGR